MCVDGVDGMKLVGRVESGSGETGTAGEGWVVTGQTQSPA